ncbi:3-isopropylmalate dehydratase small subunit [Aliiglaciecola sp. 3_MG-2023]|uniref:3-isopropylmalate dehydratase small subunit n=1 Tax=Aliiglaciecola sp. 3_MG-2023 TaxID=3062644 RepID=UPI0026E362AB|nr:3-isopropylmalate dehydratase small subunit [Aliiglaciecola sp. 3_MG-2023]MDO6693047.1 3-isopropylmalate dehydratase small subunit [Aliiglaciecola sp. 3_MG-2023]
MKAFTTHCGIAAPLLRINIDTDAIIPSREMRRVSKKGLGEGLFASSRYVMSDSRELNPDFILNKAEYANTTILLTGNNFGCGSSREHAVWALAEYGIRAIIAPSFGAIFYQNCMRNGILPVVLSNEAVMQLSDEIMQDPQKLKIEIDLQEQKVSSKKGLHFEFDIETGSKEMLLNGLDSIGLTLQYEADIKAFEQQTQKQHSWLYLQN